MYHMINNIRFIKSFDLPGTELSVLHLLSHLILKMTIWDKLLYEQINEEIQGVSGASGDTFAWEENERSNVHLKVKHLSNQHVLVWIQIIWLYSFLWYHSACLWHCFGKIAYRHSGDSCNLRKWQYSWTQVLFHIYSKAPVCYCMLQGAVCGDWLQFLGRMGSNLGYDLCQLCDPRRVA